MSKRKTSKHDDDRAMRVWKVAIDGVGVLGVQSTHQFVGVAAEAGEAIVHAIRIASRQLKGDVHVVGVQDVGFVAFDARGKEA